MKNITIKKQIKEKLKIELSLRPVEKQNIVSGKLQKTRNLDGLTPEPAIRSWDRGQWILYT